MESERERKGERENEFKTAYNGTIKGNVVLCGKIV